MQVFVTGATGYVGSSVATAFRRAGHHIWGLTRSQAKARRLAQQEIEPVVGELGDSKTYADVAAECAVLVHAAFEYSANGVAKDRKAIDALIEAGRRGAKPKTLIFTSGVWVHGDTGDRMVDETTPLNPIKLVAWRPAAWWLAFAGCVVSVLVSIAYVDRPVAEFAYAHWRHSALYVAAKMYQPPDSITANMLRQNGSITQDDTLFITLDPFNTRRAGYFFGLNANGVRYDGLYRNVSEYYSDWDTIWIAA